jgi:hypothetical protein
MELLVYPVLFALWKGRHLVPLKRDRFEAPEGVSIG